MPFLSVSAVDFEQENVCWVPPYQFINAEITYCRNYWQMYENLTEIEVHKNRVWSKVVVPNKMFFLVGYCVQSQGTFFLRYSVSLFHKSSCGLSFLNRYGIFQKSPYSHKLRIYNVFDRYLKGIELICNSSCSQPFDEWFFLYYKRTIAVMNSFKFTMSLQNMSFSKEISKLLIMIPTWVKKNYSCLRKCR